MTETLCQVLKLNFTPHGLLTLPVRAGLRYAEEEGR